MNQLSLQATADASCLIFPNLPNDVSLQILARTPRCSHGNLSLVSRSWRSALKSPHLFFTRSVIGCCDQLIFIALRIHNSSFKWFLLDRSLRRLNRNSVFLRPIPPIPLSAVGSACVVLGSRIYVIGGSVGEIPTSNVLVFDARFDEWENGPKLKVAREFAAAGVLNGKIYVIGGCLVDSYARSTSWAEVFDPEVGSWAPVPSPVEIRERWMHGSAVLNGKIFAMADRGGVVFDPKESVWNVVPKRLDLGWRGRAAVVDGILYCYDYLGKIRGYDAKEDKWKELKGIDKELPKFLCGATLANVGGKLNVVWEKGKGKSLEILCAEIEVYQQVSGELRGSVVGSEVVWDVPYGFSIVHCLASEL
ncbi:F-box/kelch-repeat protein SKIP6 [Aristolochia californica]|uniref:F-box/kelch-repeat protein SKIP6 n=1 Tax=Aristolochia californica TaxID=171875 RepID=UPI0035DA927E